MPNMEMKDKSIDRISSCNCREIVMSIKSIIGLILKGKHVTVVKSNFHRYKHNFHKYNSQVITLKLKSHPLVLQQLLWSAPSHYIARREESWLNIYTTFPFFISSML